jgi:hypothetical protein
MANHPFRSIPQPWPAHAGKTLAKLMKPEIMQSVYFPVLRFGQITGAKTGWLNANRNHLRIRFLPPTILRLQI